MKKIDNDLSPLVKTPGLNSKVEKLRDLLDRLTVEYTAKKDAMVNSVGANNEGQFYPFGV